jgi:hypothetical protein
LIRRIFRRFPLKVCLVFVVLCLALKENFPFSHFPMYESFSDYSFVVYVADKNGDPIPIEAISGQRTNALKKIFNKEQKKVRKSLEASGVKIDGYQFMTKEQRQPAGEEALRRLFKDSKPSGLAQLRDAAPLRFYYIHLRIGEDGLERETELIAEVPVPEK